MKIIETEISDLLVIEPKIYSDDRGYFCESFKKNTIDSKLSYEFNVVQENESKSNYGVLRGLHFQTGEMAQSKLVRVIQGKVLDLALDLRVNSPTFGQYFTIILSDKNRKQLFIPKGFAHGFLTLEDNTIFSYKVDNAYSPESESGVDPFDTDLNINWTIDKSLIILSDKDKNQQSLKEFLK